MATIDAILCPQNYPKGKNKLVGRNTEFGSLLGVDRVWSSIVPGGMSFVRADMVDLPNFHVAHERAGQPRYDWVDRGDGVMLGTLKPEAVGDETPVSVKDIIVDKQAKLRKQFDELNAMSPSERSNAQSGTLEILAKHIAMLDSALEKTS